ncbi:MAG: hypothetical protein ACYSWW_13470 [Planctomycetota bacterium]
MSTWEGMVFDVLPKKIDPLIRGTVTVERIPEGVRGAAERLEMIETQLNEDTYKIFETCQVEYPSG